MAEGGRGPDEPASGVTAAGAASKRGVALHAEAAAAEGGEAADRWHDAWRRGGPK